MEEACRNFSSRKYIYQFYIESRIPHLEGFLFFSLKKFQSNFILSSFYVWLLRSPMQWEFPVMFLTYMYMYRSSGMDLGDFLKPHIGFKKQFLNQNLTVIYLRYCSFVLCFQTQECQHLITMPQCCQTCSWRSTFTICISASLTSQE